MDAQGIALVAREIEKADGLQIESEDSPNDLAAAIRWSAQETRVATYLANADRISEAHELMEQTDLETAAPV